MSDKVIFDKPNALVIGGAGFIGSHLCDELVKDKKVICIDNFVTGSEGNIDHLLSNENFIFLRHNVSDELGKLEDLKDLQKFKIQFQGIQEIYFLACPTSPREFAENKMETLRVNSQGLLNGLEWSREHGSKFMFFSAPSVYGKYERGKNIKEDDIGPSDFLSERASFDEGKRFAETMVSVYREVNGVDAKIMRPFRIYGPRMRLDDHQMIPDFVNNALEGVDLEIFGDENFSSSLLYISDLVDAVIRFMESDLGGPVNVGSDVGTKMSKVAEKVIEFTGSRSGIKYGKEKMFLTELPVPDTTKARNELGWMPIVTLDKGLENTITDLRARKGLANWGEG